LGWVEAADDYADRFPNFIPEVNVVDVVRARLVCSSLTQMKTFLRKFEKGYETEIDGQKIRLTLARVKNKFSSKDLDPTRFRNVLLTLQLHCNEDFHFVELQFHYKMIVEYNDAPFTQDINWLIIMFPTHMQFLEVYRVSPIFRHSVGVALFVRPKQLPR